MSDGRPANALVALRRRQAAQRVSEPRRMSWGDAGELAAEYLTPYGNYLSAEAAVDDFGEGNWGSGALNTLGAVVGAGAVGAGLRRGGHLMLEGVERGVPMGSARSQLGIYAGPGAKTADLNALAEARRMAEGGADNETIRAATNWFQGPDQKWRFEIDDSGSKAQGPRSIAEAAELENGNKVATSAREALLHPQLSEAYPDTGAIGVTLDPASGQSGSYNRIPLSSQSHLENIRVGIQPDYSANRSVMLHELQHAVQQRENFARGGTPENALRPFYDEINKKLEALQKEMEKLEIPGQYRKFKTPEGNKLSAEYDALMQWKHSVDPYDAYRKLAGEVEARDVQARMDFTPEQRRATPPYSSEAIKPEEMTVRFGGGQSNAMKPRKLEKGLKGEPGFAYHATNAERLGDIAESNALKPHRPWYGTDQREWPDMATEKRSYFGASPENLWQFAPEEGLPVILRTKRDGRIFTESTGDLFARKPIKGDTLEFLGEDDKWYPLSEVLEPE